ncbi:unnamed protein product [Calypogeia fissa]
MELSDEGGTITRRRKLSTKHGFIITAVGGGVLIALIIGGIVVAYLKSRPSYKSEHSYPYESQQSISTPIFIAVAVCGGVVIAFILGTITLAYLTMKNPNRKLWSPFNCCCGCCLFSSKTNRSESSVKPLNLRTPSPPTSNKEGKPLSPDSTLQSKSLSRSGPQMVKAFTYEELMDATARFSKSNLLGEGGFGSVYKGTIAGTIVAVKQLKVGGGQGEREFQAEVDIISRVHHRHLVSLVGHCISSDQRLLVYKYVSNGSLYNALHGHRKPVMKWPRRMNIAIGTARGLAYLHEDCNPRIIHRDIKGSNILLGSDWQAQVADFGLAMLLADDAKTHVTTRVMGTFGYLAPEYAMSGKLTDKSDVYSFGVVILELITGKKCIYEKAGEMVSLVEWARPLLTEALEKQSVAALADPRLRGKYDNKEMFRMVEVAASCVGNSAEKRPKMAVVMRALDIQHGDLHVHLHQDEQKPGPYSDDSDRGETVTNMNYLNNTFHRLIYGTGTGIRDISSKFRLSGSVV